MHHPTLYDITTQDKERQNLRNALMFMPVPIGVTNAAGEIILFNEAFSAIFGYVGTDLVNVDTWFMLAYPDPSYRSHVIAIWGADVAEAVRVNLSTPGRIYRVTTKYGDIKRVQIMMRRVEDWYVTTFEDLTQRLLDEEELARYRQHLEQLVAERTRELASKNAALEIALQQLNLAQERLIQESRLSGLGALVAGIAHELNTPIGNARTVSSSILEMSENFAGRLQDLGSIRKSELREYVTVAYEGARLLEKNLARASDLILSFKQVSVDQASSQRRRFNLHQVAHDVLLTVHPSLKKTPFVIHNEIEADIEVVGYPGPLGQVLVNLIDNALIHGLEGRPQGVIRLASCRSDAKLQLMVVDDGHGIPKESLARIFDPFFTTRMGYGGSGLGLNIVFNIVTGLLGGDITVDSAPGEGARFTITMPLQAPIPPEPATVV